MNSTQQNAPSELEPNSGQSSPLHMINHLLGLSGQVVCVATLVILFVALFLNVVLRYAFGTGIDWAYDIHSVLFPWMIAGGVILATIHNRNVAISVLLDALPLRAARVLHFLICILVVLISVGVIYSCLPILRAAQFQKITALGGISQLWGYASLIYGFGGMALLAATQAYYVVFNSQMEVTSPPVSLS